MENIKIFACSKYAEPFTKEICEYLDIPMGKINTMKFKNDNNFVQILETVREHDVYLVQSNVPPVNERIMELLITIDAVKRASAGKINVVLPYYKYSEFFNCPIAMLDKRRDGNNDKAIGTTIIGNVKGKNAIIFDDEIDTAGSMMETVRVLKQFGAEAIYAGCTHGVLSGPAIERIQNSPIKELVITNTIPLSEEKQIPQIKVVSIAPLFAETIKRLNEKRPLGELLRKR